MKLKFFNPTVGEKNIRKTFVLLLFFSIVVSLFVRCKDELSALDKYAAQLGDNYISYIQEGGVIDLDGNLYSFTNTAKGLAVKLKSAAEGESVVSATVDPSLVSVYNDLYNEKYESIPTEAFKTSNDGTFVIANGATSSVDSLWVELADGSTLKDGHLYVVPVRLESKNKGALSYSLVFFKMRIGKQALEVRMNGGSEFNRAKPSFRSGSLYFNNVILNDNEGNPKIPESVRLNVTLNSLFKAKDLKVEASIMNDEASIQEYSKRAGTSFTPFPEGTFELTKNSVTIPAGSLLSSDSLKINFHNKEKLERLKWYLVGLKLKKASEDPAVPPTSSDSSMAFISFFLIR